MSPGGADCAPFSASDRLFLGEGLFETLRVEKGRACYALHHWQRLKQSAEIIQVPFFLSFLEWLETIQRAIIGAKIVTGGVKLVLFSCGGKRGLEAQGELPRIAVEAFPYALPTTPARLMSSSWTRDAANPIYRIKSINYLEAVLAKREAIAAGYDDVMFFNTREHLAESSAANVFLIKDNQLMTPARSDGVLPGIVRSRLKALCLEQSIACEEKSLSRQTLRQADAVFLTNALMGIRPVATIDTNTYQLDHPLIHQLRELLIHDIARFSEKDPE